jgi:hypothetical protein
VIIGIFLKSGLHGRFSHVSSACIGADGFSFLTANLSGKVGECILSGKWQPCSYLTPNSIAAVVSSPAQRLPFIMVLKFSVVSMQNFVLKSYFACCLTVQTSIAVILFNFFYEKILLSVLVRE